MNVGKLIHERWAAAAALNALLPVSRVVTGTYFAEEPSLDDGYATITRPGDAPLAWFADGSRLDRVPVRITVYVSRDKHDEGEAIADAVKMAFDGAACSLSTDDMVLRMMLSAYQPLDDDDGNWYFILDFDCTVSSGGTP
jgi:hypothetical protein